MLATHLEKYASHLREWILPYFIEKRPPAPPERLCLQVANHDLSLVKLKISTGLTEVLLIDHITFDDITSIPMILSGLIEKHALESTPLYWLLAPEDYQLFLIESLPAADNELRGALSWRVRSLINFPIEDAAIDYFKLPPKRGAANNMIAAVVAKKSQLSPMIQIFKDCHLNLSIIGIPEIAMRNLTAVYETDEKSTAFIYFYQTFVILNISREKNLYFTRRIPLNTTSSNDKDHNEYEALSLEILRYFDYFQSQWRHPSPTRVFVACDHKNSTAIATALSEFLLIPTLPYQVKSLMGSPTLIDSLNHQRLLTLGCALHEEAIDA